MEKIQKLGLFSDRREFGSRDLSEIVTERLKPYDFDKINERLLKLETTCVPLVYVEDLSATIATEVLNQFTSRINAPMDITITGINITDTHGIKKKQEFMIMKPVRI